jgi:hypothetical protein
MLDAFHLGGWGMYPTTILGIAFLLTVGRSFGDRNRDQQRVGAALVLAGSVLVSGFLGLTTGIMRTLRVATESELPDLAVVCIGTAEALNNIVLALLFLVIGGILAAFLMSRSSHAC